jgi:inorganic pyrophosphatase/exopolyphosphatase
MKKSLQFLVDNRKFKEAEGIKILSEALGDSLKRMFDYGSVKGDVLTLYFVHPAGVWEFNSKKDEILKKMREIYKEKSLRELIYFKSVKAKSSLKRVIVSEDSKDNRSNFNKELANGEFDLSGVEDVQLRKILSNIRECIKRNKERE